MTPELSEKSRYRRKELYMQRIQSTKGLEYTGVRKKIPEQGE